jgi:hypothetical protein
MNSINKKSPGARGIPQPFNRQAGHAPQFKPGVAQLKTAVSAQSVKRPVAPPVYRPQAKLVGVQAKMAGSAQLKTHPVAPPVYKPQPVPKVLQTKKTVNQQAVQRLQQHKPFAPPVPGLSQPARFPGQAKIESQKLGHAVQAVRAKSVASPRSAVSHNTIQRVKGLAEQTQVEVLDERGVPWYGEIETASEGFYKIRVGGTSTKVTVPEGRVDLHPTLKVIKIWKIIEELDEEGYIFKTRCGAKRSELSSADKLVFDEIEKYLVENNVQTMERLTLHDGSKKTLVASGAHDVLKIYYPNSRGVYIKEKEYYQTLKEKNANMKDFVWQSGWNDATLTARAENLQSASPPGDKRQAASQILQRLSEVGLFLNDLDRGDNIGTSMDGRAVVFDVKSLVSYDKRKYEINF